MRAHLKGLLKVRKILADGTARYYCYAWRAGPLLRDTEGRPLQLGDPAMVGAFAAAHEARRNPQTNDLAMLIRQYRLSSDFRTLSASTRREYDRYLDEIWRRFGLLSFDELQQPATRGRFKEWRDELAEKPRTADYAWTTLARVLSFAKDRGMVGVNVCERGGRIYAAERAEKVWAEADLDAVRTIARAEMLLALEMALWTGQRQGDLLRLAWTAYDGDALRLRQGKTGARVVVPVAAPLRTLLDGATRPAKTILTTTRGTPWTEDGFRTAWGRLCTQAGINGLTFHDLRGTTVTRLALAGCTTIEIAAVTGHSPKDVDAILRAHYLGGQVELARQAIGKLEGSVKSPY